MIAEINDFFSDYNFDVREANGARFMDQKVLPDVLSAVSECIIEFIKDNINREFTVRDIWDSPYAQTLITESFNKPNLKNADSEYNKFFGQPIKTLSFSKVLNERKEGNTYFFSVNNYNILEYISLRERNSLNFLEIFLSKVIQESGLSRSFENFFNKQDKQSLNDLRTELFSFFHTHTNIEGDYEPPRIFNKIINILAFKRKVKGTVRGTVSKIILPIEEIRYNRINWRDIGKDKGITREEFEQTLDKSEEISGYYQYNVQKAKRFVRQLHPHSEIHRFEAYPGLQAHHIFMQSEFPEIADCPENIICLTPNQHYFRAHPNNKTSIIDENYQIICLISKLDSIEINFRNGKSDYSLTDFVDVLNTGYRTDYFKPEMDFEGLKHQIMSFNSNHS